MLVVRILPPSPSLSATAATTGRAHREFERECVEFFAETVQVFGVPKSVGQIYGLLFGSPEPLSLSDIVERLEISKGSASQGLQFLRALGAVSIVTSKSVTPEMDHSRRDYYEPELSLRRLLSGVLRERVAPLAGTGAERVTRLRRLAGENNFRLDRVRQLEIWRRRLKTVLPVLGTLLGSTSEK